MAKRGKKLDTDPRQMSLLDMLQRSEELRPEIPTEGGMNVHLALCQSLTCAIREAERLGVITSRHDLAGQMSHLLGVEVTKTTIDSWTAPSKLGNRIPAEYLPAFCAVVECREPLQILTDTAGLFCLPGPEALRAEIQRFSEEEKKIRAERRKREMFLQEMEGAK